MNNSNKNSQNRIKLSESQNKKLEIISIFLLIAFATFSLFIKNTFLNTNKENIALYINGERITELNGNKIDINTDNTFIIGDLNSDYNIIEIKNKKQAK